MTKPKKDPTPAQLAAREKFAQAARERAAKAKADKLNNHDNGGTPAPEPRPGTAPALPEDTVEHIADEGNLDQLKAQIKEIQETNALLKAALLGNQNNQPSQSIGVNRQGGMVGEVERYLVDPNNYPDPTPRLAKEPRLQAVNFNYNYELDYNMDIVSYETKTGINMKEPKFHISLNRVVLDDQGNRTDKRYIAKRLVFHEDPQAAIVIARENGLPIDDSNEKAFLDEMRYLRCRDWLFGVFWPTPPSEKAQIREEVIGGTIVQVFTKASQDSSEIEFDKLTNKF